MKNIIIRFNSRTILLLLMIISLGSCKDFLEVQPKSQASNSTVWATTGNADLFLNDVYSSIGQMASGNWPFRNEDPDDNRTDDGFGKPTSGSRNIYKGGAYNSTNAQVSYWGQYTNVRKANVL